VPALRYRQITSPASDSGGAARLPLCRKVLVARTLQRRSSDITLQAERRGVRQRQSGSNTAKPAINVSQQGDFVSSFATSNRQI
jgi:hypothetical protein